MLEQPLGSPRLALFTRTFCDDGNVLSPMWSNAIATSHAGYGPFEMGLVQLRNWILYLII